MPEDLLIDLVSAEWVDERKKRWGVTSPIYTSKVLGEFPDISDDTLIMPKWIEAAQARSIPRDRHPHLAVDVARYGEDETIIMRREGGWARVYRAHSKTDTIHGSYTKITVRAYERSRLAAYVARPRRCSGRCTSQSPHQRS